jgi:predicted N-acetyltransferase YhbS
MHQIHLGSKGNSELQQFSPAAARSLVYFSMAMSISGPVVENNHQHKPTETPMERAPAVTFRFAEPHDANAIRTIEFEAGQRFLSVDMAGIADAPPMDLELVERKIAAREVIVAVNAEATCAGFVMFEPQPLRIYVQELDVLTSHAGQRIGAALIEQVAQIARGQRLKQLILSTFREVPWNAPYYRRLGFREIEEAELDAALIARRDAHIARGLDESKRVFMRRDLA